MDMLIDFFQSLGIAEFIITICLVAICVIAWFDCKSIDKKYDADQNRFDENYPR